MLRVWIGGWRHVEHLDPTKAHTGGAGWCTDYSTSSWLENKIGVQQRASGVLGCVNVVIRPVVGLKPQVNRFVVEPHSLTCLYISFCTFS